MMTAFGGELRERVRDRGTSLRALARETHYHVSHLSKVMNGRKRPSPELAQRLDTALGAAGALADAAARDRAAHRAAHPEEGDPTDRRDALKLGLVGALTPDTLNRVLHDAAAEALEFTRHTGTTTIGAGTFEHLETVVTELSQSYATRAPAEQFTVALTYRRRVQNLIKGRHTLAEGRELYVYAGWLSELLAWLADDLGAHRTAHAYAIDCFHHGDQAGDSELCAQAMNVMASIALHGHRAETALSAAQRGMAKAPSHRPLLARLHAQAARAHARLGQREQTEALFARSREIYETLPARTPGRFIADTSGSAALTLTGFPASAYIWLNDFTKAKQHAQAALAAHGSAPHQGKSPTREAGARIDLAIALAGLGEPEEAAALGHRALASPRIVSTVLAGAALLDSALTARYAALPETRAFHERLVSLNM